MARENFRKVKLLKLLEMLKQNTDEQHPMSTSGILNSLALMEIPCDRRTLSQDIATLNDLGYENSVTCTGGCYYSGSLENVPNWVYNSNYWYWTMSPYEDSISNVWFVFADGGLNSYESVSARSGVVRPVVTILKSAL